MRKHKTFPFDHPGFKSKLYAWTSNSDPFAYLDSNGHPGDWDVLAAKGAREIFEFPVGEAFEQLKQAQANTGDWLFGAFSYDLKNEVEQLVSQNFDGIRWPALTFFRPETVVGIHNQLLHIWTWIRNPDEIYREILDIPNLHTAKRLCISLQSRISKADYLNIVQDIREHIAAGDVYELNFCQEFYAENTVIDPIITFQSLNDRARAPFAAFFRWGDRYLLCASPERFLKKEGNRIFSQPIKGTRRRGTTGEEDQKIISELLASEKDRAENVMIVDLVRNDLARTCVPGSVQVPELFGIHSFESVHQMISTVEGRLRPGIVGLDALRFAFPMGSMTGAPKVMAMQLIERYERTRRGIYSGAVGYITPEGDFDFNVVIRSLVYNAEDRYLSAQVGGAIVYDSIAEEEYEECLVKLKNVKKILEG